jgi:hypothetical protein
MRRMYDDYVENWKSDYASGMTIWEVGRKYSVSGQAVHRYLREVGAMRSKENACRKEPINASAFDDLSVGDAAYWLGLLYADGSMSTRNGSSYSIGITAHEDDLESVTGFLAFLGLNGPLIGRRDKRAVSTIVTSKTLTKRLLDLGVVPRKTHTIRLPALPQCARRHFVRGFFDGDGCVGFRHRPRYRTAQGFVKITGCAVFIDQVSDLIKHEIGVGPTNIKQDSATTASLSYEGRNKLFNIYEWFYGVGGRYLSRKEIKFRFGLFHGTPSNEVVYEPIPWADGDNFREYRMRIS